MAARKRDAQMRTNTKKHRRKEGKKKGDEDSVTEMVVTNHMPAFCDPERDRGRGSRFR